MSGQKCPACGLMNWSEATNCKRCNALIHEASETYGVLPPPPMTFEGEKPARGLGFLMIIWGFLFLAGDLYLLLTFGSTGPGLVVGPVILITGIFVMRGRHEIFFLYFLGVAVLSVWLAKTQNVPLAIGSFFFSGLIGLLVAKRRLPVVAGLLMGLSCVALFGTIVFSAVMLQGVKKVAWRDFRPAQGLFTVQMPSEPIAHEPTTERSGPYMFTRHMYESRVGGGSTLYIVVDFSPPLSMENFSYEKALDWELNNIAQKTSSAIVSKTNVTVNGYPGVEFELKPPDNLALASPKSFGKIFMNSEHEYLMSITASEGSELLAGKDTFLNPQFSYRTANQPRP